jgi:hypothetical protein
MLRLLYARSGSSVSHWQLYLPPGSTRLIGDS